MQGLQGSVGRGLPLAAAQQYSRFGEHALGWLALGTVGVAACRRRRMDWAEVAASAFTAHAAAVVLKRVVRRPRPNDSRLEVFVKTPSDLSFPSAHVASTTGAAFALTLFLPKPVAVGLATAMAAHRGCWSACTIRPMWSPVAC